jgi:hydrogenase expression/formation protein HypC
MCLAIPGKILKIEGNSALIDFEGIQQKVIIALIQNPEIGKYVIVHAGYAIEMMNEDEAKLAIEEWKELANEQDLDLKDII